MVLFEPNLSFQEYYYIEKMLCAQTMEFLDDTFSSSAFRAFSLRQFRALRAFKSDWLGLDKLNEKPEFQASMCCTLAMQGNVLE
jgi:hypothetical protein